MNLLHIHLKPHLKIQAFILKKKPQGHFFKAKHINMLYYLGTGWIKAVRKCFEKRSRIICLQIPLGFIFCYIIHASFKCVFAPHQSPAFGI